MSWFSSITFIIDVINRQVAMTVHAVHFGTNYGFGIKISTDFQKDVHNGAIEVLFRYSAR